MTAAHGSGLGDAVAAVLRAAGGPLGARDIIDRLPRSMRHHSPKQVGDAAREHRLCLSTRRAQYVYLPTAVTGAAVFLPHFPDPRKHRYPLPLEAIRLLWPEADWFGFGPASQGSHLPAEVELPGGRHVHWQAHTVEADADMLGREPVVASAASGFLLHCLDGEAKHYAVEPCPAPSPAEADEQEARWLAAAERLLLAGRSYPPYQLAMRLLAGGAYHGEPPRATLAVLTSRPPFVRELDITFRPDLTPAMWRLFEGRMPYGYLRPDTAAGSSGLPPPVARGVTYRLRAHLHRGPWWVEFELAAEHTLDQLHVALQTALGWDNDHLYAFYLSGRHGDRLTAVVCPWSRERGPITEAVTLGHFDPPPGSHFAYLFDVGDNWEFVVDVVARTAGGSTPMRPRRVAMHGRPPEQYPESIE